MNNISSIIPIELEYDMYDNDTGIFKIYNSKWKNAKFISKSISWLF